MFYHLFIISAVTLTAYCQYTPSQYGSSSQLSSAPRFSSSSLSSSSQRFSPSSQLGSIPQYSSSQQFSPSSQLSSNPQYSSSQFSPSQFSSNQYLTTPSPKPSFPPAQIHYVNIGADLAGDYKFGYDTGKGPTGQSFREESRLPDGTVRGAYGYVDANGQQRIVKYTAGKEGFKVEGDSEAGAPAADLKPVIPQLQPTYSAPASQSYRPPTQTFSQPSIQPYRGSAAQAYRPAAPVQAYREPSQAISIPVQRQYQSSPPQYSQPLPQRSQQPIYRSQPSLASNFGIESSSKPEEVTYGPPVINTALLNYNIGTQHG
jgi:hypothetical protein